MNHLNFAFQGQLVHPSFNYSLPQGNPLMSMIPSLVATQKPMQQQPSIDQSVLVKRTLTNPLMIPAMDPQKKIKLGSPDISASSANSVEVLKASLMNMREQAIKELTQKMYMQQSILAQAQQAALASNFLKLSAQNTSGLNNINNSHLLTALNFQTMKDGLQQSQQSVLAPVVNSIPQLKIDENTVSAQIQEKTAKLNKTKAKEETKKKVKRDPIVYDEDTYSDDEEEEPIEDDAYIPNNRRIKKSIEMTPKRVLRQRRVNEKDDDNSEEERRILMETVAILEPLLGYVGVNQEKVFKLLQKVDMSPKKFLIKVKRNRTYYIKYFETPESTPKPNTSEVINAVVEN